MEITFAREGQDIFECLMDINGLVEYSGNQVELVAKSLKEMGSLIQCFGWKRFHGIHLLDGRGRHVQLTAKLGIY